MATLRTKTTAGFAAAALALVGAFEGLRLVAYRDGGGVPTICYGATAGVALGQSATKVDCDSRLVADLASHEAAMRACLPGADQIPEKVYLASLSLTYNIGARAACNSTLFIKLRAGDWRGACEQFPRWVYDNGVKVPGLVNRRAAERALCLQALP
jgi:lysozyme